MKVKEIKEILGLELAGGEKGIENEIKDGYCGDLLSDVMANAPEGCIWITIQTHQNIVAVAILREMAGIIITGDHSPDEDTKKKADEEGVPILLSSMTSFEISGRIFELGIGKKRDRE
ncbi:MAG: serine kinase [Deltaproteobacteria bacterium]|nr:MAG: serine kinase [Deltaproteobacteria bacterium]